MDKQEFEVRTTLIKQQLGNDELFQDIEREARQDERVRNMAERIKGLRVANRAAEADELVSTNRDLIDDARREAMIERGLQGDINEMEQKLEERRLLQLEKIHEGLTGEESDSELLKAFHLTDEEGRFSDDTFHSPLFRERTKMAFEAYRTAVTSFEALVDYNRLYGVPSKNVGPADSLRGEAHNEVARQVAEDLGLEFKTARSLVAKIRDGVIPRSSEEETYKRSIFRIGKRLSRRFGEDIAEAVKADLQPIFDPTEPDEGSSNPHAH
jgi:hypothetical protein